MSDKSSSDGVHKTRSALGDVTNLVAKRGFSLISTSGVKSGDDRFGKKGCIRIESFKKENFGKETVGCVLQPHSCSENDSLKGDSVDCVSKVLCETKEPCTPNVREDAYSETAIKSGDADVRGEAGKDERSCFEGVFENASKEQVEPSTSMNDDNDVTLDNLDFSKGDYIDSSRLPESEESRSYGLEKCVGQKGDACSNMGMDLVKACSCTFCMKAAYIWSDLHYQDIKGRIAALKKSQKEASILVQQNSRDIVIGKHGQGNFDKSSKLESNLTDQWKSLFLHMEDIFVRESSQLESSLSTLKGLRDNCKTDLDPTDGMNSEKH